MESISIVASTVAAMFLGEAIKEVGKGCGVTQQQVL
jgi:preprotein translocase subunit SecY